MEQGLVILDEDKTYVRQRIRELEIEIQGLGPEFHEVFNQSSETWHDNAPFDALRDRQSLLDAELQNLRSVLRRSLPIPPPQPRGEAGIGARVELSDGTAYNIRGDWSPWAGSLRRGAMVISAQSPLAEALRMKRVGDEVLLGKKKRTITDIRYDTNYA